jgi:hypothetical protein
MKPSDENHLECIKDALRNVRDMEIEEGLNIDNLPDYFNILHCCYWLHFRYLSQGIKLTLLLKYKYIRHLYFFKNFKVYEKAPLRITYKEVRYFL